MSNISTHLYTCYFDLVGSSSSKLDIHQQIEKLEQLNNVVKEIIYPSTVYADTLVLEPYYSSSTGDGGILCFEKALPIIQFSILLHMYLALYNKKQKEDLRKIRVRIGASGGETLPVYQFNRAGSSPWGRDMVIAKRIMDIACPNQILINNYTVSQINQFVVSDKRYSFIDKGKHETKHGEVMEVSTFIFENKVTGEIIGNDNKLECNCPTCNTSSDELRVSM